MNVLDTNVILRYLTGDDERKTQRGAELFERAEQGRTVLYTTVLAIAEIVWVLGSRHGHSKAKIVDGLRGILNTRGVVIEDRDALLLALQLFEQHPIDFIDAYHGALMQARGLTTIYSYDTDFDRLEHIQRVEP